MNPDRCVTIQGYFYKLWLNPWASASSRQDLWEWDGDWKGKRTCSFPSSFHCLPSLSSALVLLTDAITLGSTAALSYLHVMSFVFINGTSPKNCFEPGPARWANVCLVCASEWNNSICLGWSVAWSNHCWVSKKKGHTFVLPDPNQAGH